MQVAVFKPEAVKLDKFLLTKKDLDFSYPEVGASQSENPEGYDNDFNSIFLGKGEKVWQNAIQAIRNWQQFPTPWTRLYPPSTALQKGNCVAVLFRLFGLWWINSARIVYAFDEPSRFGFAYGTLIGHVEKGEECFWVDRNEAGEVFYHIRAFSKPAYWFVKLAYPLARMYQRKFVKESMQRMKQLSNK